MKKIIIQDDNLKYYLIDRKKKQDFYSWLRMKNDGVATGECSRLTTQFEQCKIKLGQLLIKDYSLTSGD